jgi:hypothetical protein
MFELSETPFGLHHISFFKFQATLDAVPENTAIHYSNEEFRKTTEEFLAHIGQLYTSTLTRALCHIEGLKLKKDSMTDENCIATADREIAELDRFAQAADNEETTTRAFSYLDGYHNATPRLNDLLEVTYVHTERKFRHVYTSTLNRAHGHINVMMLEKEDTTDKTRVECLNRGILEMETLVQAVYEERVNVYLADYCTPSLKELIELVWAYDQPEDFEF